GVLEAEAVLVAGVLVQLEGGDPLRVPVLGLLLLRGREVRAGGADGAGQRQRQDQMTNRLHGTGPLGERCEKTPPGPGERPPATEQGTWAGTDHAAHRTVRR